MRTGKMTHNVGFMSYEEIAVRLFVEGLSDHILTRQRIQQIERAAMAKLRKLAPHNKALAEWSP